jgi:cell wall-associated NlpC family hydrolase
VVESGDTLWQIAQDAGTDVASLSKLNGLQEDDVIAVGQSLKLPAAPAPASGSASAPGRARTYTVADGDTLSSIALQLGTTTAALVDANHLDDPDRLAIGTELIASGQASSGGVAPPRASSAAASSAPAPAHKSILVAYTVQSGETLSQIAKQFDVRADAIAQASGVDDPNRIAVGAVLKVPLPGYEHVVKQGETLRDIAAQAKVDLGSLVDFNNLDDPELIRVDQVILVPAPTPGLQAAAAGAPRPAAPPPSAAAPNPQPAQAQPAQAQPAAQAQPTAQAQPQPAAQPKPASAPPAATAPSGGPKQSLVGAAQKLLGAAYVWGGSSPAGFDCSGYVWYVVRQTGKSVSRGLLGQYNSGSHPGRDELKAGDLVFFQNTYTPGVSHNGIYLGNGQFIHAADEQAGVTVSSLSTAYWSSHWFGATRLP